MLLKFSIRHNNQAAFFFPHLSQLTFKFYLSTYFESNKVVSAAQEEEDVAHLDKEQFNEKKSG